MMLDLDAVRLFVLSAEFGSLTRAAEAAGTTQPVVSQRLKALEARLGRRLLDRTPRLVRPTHDGEAFLPRARALLAAHDRALRFGQEEPAPRFSFGVSDHALGIGLAEVLRRLRAALPGGAAVALRTGMSQPLREAFDAGEFDAVLVRREGGGAGGEVLGVDPLGWRAAGGFGPPAPPEAAALLAGAEAGLGVAPMGRAAAGRAPDRGPALGLPPLPASEVVLFGRASSPAAAAGLRAPAAGGRAGPR